jgi:hypothetical protein
MRLQKEAPIEAFTASSNHHSPHHPDNHSQIAIRQGERWHLGQSSSKLEQMHACSNTFEVDAKPFHRQQKQVLSVES